MNPEQHLKNCRPHLPQLRSVFMIQQKETGQKRPPWQSSMAKATADQKEHKGLKKACIRFAKKNLDYPQDFWANILWTDETKVELFRRCVSPLHLG